MQLLRCHQDKPVVKQRSDVGAFSIGHHFRKHSRHLLHKLRRTCLQHVNKLGKQKLGKKHQNSPFKVRDQPYGRYVAMGILKAPKLSQLFGKLHGLLTPVNATARRSSTAKMIFNYFFKKKRFLS